MPISDLIKSALRLESERPEEAERLLEETIREHPGSAEAALALAGFLERHDRLEDAARRLRESGLEDSVILMKQSELQNALGDLEGARKTLDRETALRPKNESAIRRLADIHAANGNLEDAAKSYRALAMLDPKERMWAMSAIAYYEADGQPEACADLLRKLDPSDTGSLELLRASALAGAGKRDELKAHVKRVEFNTVNSARRLFDLAMICQESKLNDAAERLYRAVSSAAPDQPAAWFNLAIVLTERNKTEDALKCFDKAIELGLRPARLRRATSVPIVYSSQEEIDAHRARTDEALRAFIEDPSEARDPEAEFGAPCFFFAYQGLSNKETNRLAAQAVEAGHPSLRWTADVAPAHAGKLRLVFASGHWRDHTVTHITEGLVRQIDRSKFEVIGVGPQPPVDADGRRIAAAFDRFVVVGKPYQPAREAIARLRPDAIYYPDIGMEPWSYQLGFSRIARVQLLGWGHADTSGLPEIDAVVSCSGFEPDGAESFYSERIERLGRIPAFLPTPGPLSGAEVDANLFLCPQSLFKFHPAFDGVLARILESSPEARIECFEGPDREWRRALEARWAETLGGNANRVKFLKRLPLGEFQAKLATAGCILDTPYFGGGYTLSMAYGAGIPVPVWNGRCMRERMGAAMAEQMGVSELVADGEEAYAGLALRIAQDSAFRSSLAGKVRSGAGELFEDARSVREFEDLVLRLCQG